MQNVPIDDSIPLRGKGPTSGARRNRVYADDRVCAAQGCTTRLSVYNASAECWQHTDVKPFVLQVPRKRRKASGVTG